MDSKLVVAKVSHLLLVSALFVCLVVAQEQQQLQLQQQQPNPTSAAPVNAQPNCTLTKTKPAPKTQDYHFNTCLVFKLAAYLEVGQGEYLELSNGQVDANSSKCESKDETPKLVINFDCGQLAFDVDHSNDSKVYVKAVNGLYHVGNQSVTFHNASQPLFSTTQSGHYYKCNSEQPILTEQKAVTVVLSNFAYEAYRASTGTEFYQVPEECGLDSGPVSDLVRIGVGISLIALVAIVLVAYFIGRRRWSERSSYESV